MLSAERDNARTEGEGERGTKLSQVYCVIMPERQECGYVIRVTYNIKYST